jgi:hypothetical protein
MKLSDKTYDALMSVEHDLMNDCEFHLIFDIWVELTNDDLSPKDPKHTKLVQHLAGELQI